MRPRARIALAVTAGLALILAAVAWRRMETTGSSPLAEAIGEPQGGPDAFAHRVRAYRIAAERPDVDPEAIAAELTRSDAVVAALRAQGVQDVGAEISMRLASVNPSEAELHACFERNHAVFGERNELQSRDVLIRLVAIERVKADLEALIAGR